jgi:uncharacterized membrane protein YccF (DUF307 family)
VIGGDEPLARFEISNGWAVNLGHVLTGGELFITVVGEPVQAERLAGVAAVRFEVGVRVEHEIEAAGLIEGVMAPVTPP